MSFALSPSMSVILGLSLTFFGQPTLKAEQFPAQPSPTPDFLHHCQNPGQEPQVDIAIDALKYYIKKDDCKEAHQALLKSTWLELDHPELTDLRVVNGFPQTKSLTVFSDRAVNLADLTALDRLAILKVVAPLSTFDFPGRSLDRLHLENTEKLTFTTSANLAGLAELILANAPVANPEALSKLRSLAMLQADHSELTDVSWLASLTSLERAYLDHNAIKDVSPFASLPKLRHLALSLNPITDISPLAGLDLEILRISNIPLEDIGQLRLVADVNHLTVSGLKLANLDFLGECTKLEGFTANGNDLEDVSALAECQKLRDLSLRFNKLTSLGDLSGLTGLLNIDASYNELNRIGKLPSSAFDVRLAHNPIVALDDFADSDLSGLYRLNLGHTEVTEFAGLRRLTGLAELIVNDSKVQSLAGLEALRGLRSLSVDFGEVTSVEPLRHLKQLRSLSLLANKITDVSPLAGLAKIVHLDLYSNPLGDTVAKTAENCPTHSANRLLNEFCEQ